MKFLEEQLRIEEARYKLALSREAQTRRVSPQTSRIAEKIERLRAEIEGSSRKRDQGPRSRRNQKFGDKVHERAYELFSMGTTTEDVRRILRDEFGLDAKEPSVGWVNNTMKAWRSRPADAGPDSPAEPMPELDQTPPSDEEVRGWLAAQLRDQQAAQQAARTRGDDTAAQRASKNVVQLLAILARVKAPDDERDIVKVNVREIDAAATRCREKMHATLDDVLENPDHPFRVPLDSGAVG